MKRLQILYINKIHYMLGGAEAVYFTTAELMEKHGHKSLFFSMRHPKNIPAETEGYFAPFLDIERNSGVFNLIRASLNVLYSFSARRCIARLLDNYNVDIVHIHNIHRQMSPSILHELRKRNIPVVMTLHEHKMVCPSFLLLAHGRPCEACKNGRYYNALKIRCVKNSLLRSFLAMIEAYLHFSIMDIYKNVDIFIAPSMFLKDKHEEMGFKKKLVHLPYPLDLKKYEYLYKEPQISKGDKIRFIYFGRIVKEKGVFTFIDAILQLLHKFKRDEVEFKIIGDGPAKEEIKERSKDMDSSIGFTGFLEGERLYKEVSNAHVIVIPSEWYENYPVSVMEAFTLGRPVIGSRIGGIPEMVQNGETGLTFNPGDSEDLCEKMAEFIHRRDNIIKMGRNAREFAMRVFDAESHYSRLIEIYKMAMDRKRT
ncbi:MAG: glycosyltransferase family 4 protein [Thermodesulfovibrionia bacterium]